MTTTMQGVPGYSPSELIKYQTSGYTTEWKEGKKRYTMIVTVRHDDRCGNGHNTFSVTADIHENGREYSCGTMPDEVARRFPDLAPYLKWHLTSTDGPMHYVDNTFYWLGYGKYSEENLEHARKCAVWPELPESFLASKSGNEDEVKAALLERLPGLMAEFRTAVESLGFVY